MSMTADEIVKVLREVQITCFRRDLKKAFPKKTRREIDDLIYLIGNLGSVLKK